MHGRNGCSRDMAQGIDMILTRPWDSFCLASPPMVRGINRLSRPSGDCSVFISRFEMRLSLFEKGLNGCWTEHRAFFISREPARRKRPLSMDWLDCPSHKVPQVSCSPGPPCFSPASSAIEKIPGFCTGMTGSRVKDQRDPADGVVGRLTAIS